MDFSTIMKIYLLFLLAFSPTMSGLVDQNTIPIEKKVLYTPPLEELATVLNEGLKNDFQNVSVSVVDCPDLSKDPFFLAKPGLSGGEKLVEIGGVPYLLPLVSRDRVYDLKHIVGMVRSDPAFIVGAGAGPFPYTGTNCEGIFNLYLNNGTVDQHTRISKVNLQNPSEPIQDILPNEETRLALLGNLFLSEGKPGKVLEVHVKKRIGDNDFATAIRTILENYYKDQPVGLGGAFLIKEGKAKQHVMPDFSKTPINSDEELNNWLHFYNMSAPLVAVGTLINNDCDLDLRVQHFHSFSHHNEAGHYHIDTTPDVIEYLGYFNVGKEIYRIDRPVTTHKMGRD